MFQDGASLVTHFQILSTFQDDGRVKFPTPGIIVDVKFPTHVCCTKSNSPGLHNPPILGQTNDTVGAAESTQINLGQRNGTPWSCLILVKVNTIIWISKNQQLQRNPMKSSDSRTNSKYKSLYWVPYK